MKPGTERVMPAMPASCAGGEGTVMRSDSRSWSDCKAQLPAAPETGQACTPLLSDWHV
jgi:hypothetical protein